MGWQAGVVLLDVMFISPFRVLILGYFKFESRMCKEKVSEEHEFRRNLPTMPLQYLRY